MGSKRDGRAKRLRVPEMQAWLSEIGKWPDAYRLKVAPLYFHAIWLEYELEDAQRELREIRQVNLLNPEKPIATPIRPGASPTNAMKEPEVVKSSSHGERMYFLFSRGGLDGRTIKAYCEMMRVRQEDCFVAANEWAIANGKAPLVREDY